MKNSFFNLLLVFTFLISIVSVQAQDEVMPGTIRIDATFENISVNYEILGDENRNSELSISYREAGVGEFEEAAITMRAYPGLIIDGNTTNYNFHAGSVMFLSPGSTYELQFELTDPDGGDLTTTQFVTTKAIPQPAEFSNIRYVSPGDGGGNGTESSPYLGLQEAADNAQQGDLFMVAPGTYQSFNLLNSGTESNPIVFKSEVQHEAIIDGDQTDRGIITLAEFNVTIAHVIIDGFTIQNGNWAIDAQNTTFITVRNNIFQDVGFGYVNRRENGIERDQYITNNFLTGTNAWPSTGIPSERAIDVRGNNNVISYNTIVNFGDGISTDGPMYEQSYSLDIHNNEIKNIVDDHIEVDGTVSNSRIYANRGFNGRAGVSVAPVYGGPVYIFRNILFNSEISAFKMNRGPSGIVAVHNTSVSENNVFESPDGWQNTYFRNNVFLASRYCFEMFGLVEESIDDWDYGAYYSTRGGEAGTEWFKWNNIRYRQVAELQASGILQANSIEVAFSDFENAALPDIFPVEYDASERDFSPVANSAVLDNGDQITHLNKEFVFDGMPDRGAYEFGEEKPQYGHDFSVISNVIEISSSTNVYPNPFNDLIMVEGNIKNKTIELYNLQGLLLLSESCQNEQMSLDVSNLQAGMYIIKIGQNHGDTCFKVIKN